MLKGSNVLLIVCFKNGCFSSANTDLLFIGSDNGLLSVRRQAIIWTNTEILKSDPQEQTSMKF